jgi:hypothetical protein
MKTLITVLLLLVGSLAQGQDQHKFFDWKNTTLLTTTATAITGESISGQRIWAFDSNHLAYFEPNGNRCADPISFIGFEALCHVPARCESNPFARALGSSRAGQAAAGLTTFGVTMGGMYLSHRMERHHGRVWGWVERAVPTVVTGLELNYTRTNYANVRSLPVSIKRPTAQNH